MFRTRACWIELIEAMQSCLDMIQQGKRVKDWSSSASVSIRRCFCSAWRSRCSQRRTVLNKAGRRETDGRFLFQSSPVELNIGCKESCEKISPFTEGFESKWENKAAKQLSTSNISSWLTSILGVVQNTFSKKLSLRRPWANLARILREHSKTTCSIQISFFLNLFSWVYVYVNCCHRRRVYKPQGRGLATHFSTFPVCVCLLHCSFPVFQTLCRTAGSKKSTWPVQFYIHSGLRGSCANLARTLRGFRSCFGHIPKHMAKTLWSILEAWKRLRPHKSRFHSTKHKLVTTVFVEIRVTSK